MLTKNSNQILVFLLTLLPSLSLAAPMGVIFVEGDKPSRVAYAAEFLNTYDHSSSLNALMNAQTDADYKKLQNEQKQVEMRVIAIYENKTAPESIDMTLEFQCHKEAFRIIQAHAMLRNATEKRTKQDWKPYTSGNSAFPIVAAKVACEQDMVSNAAKEVAASKNGQDFSAFDKLGIIYIGDLDRLQVVDTVWKTILADGTRPAYKGKTLTAQETKAWNDKLDKKLAEAKKQASDYEALASTELGKMKEEQEFKKEIAANNKKHTDLFGRESKQYKQLKWLVGKTEKDIVRKAGAPTNVVEAGDARFLTYYNEYFIPGVGYYLDNNGNEIYGGTTVTCELKIELRQSRAKVDFRAVDYQIDATNGGCRDLSWFNRDTR
ncbi:MAG: hypothetical protein PHO76_09175 [Methylotenera sp.]|nr:hypothetical protein [Methylotenera sp.]MDD4925933.1 hypothetical protein [Methylotenera sp.]